MFIRKVEHKYEQEKGKFAILPLLRDNSAEL